MCATVAEMMKRKRNFLLFFSKFKRANSVKNHRTMTKSEFDLHITVTYPYIKFELNVCNLCRDNEQKPNDDGMTE